MLMTLIVIGAAAILFGLFKLQSKIRYKSERKRSLRQRAEREQERDRRACMTAQKSRPVPALGEAFEIPAEPVDASVVASVGPSRRETSDDKRRAATSTLFDPDLPVG